MASKPKQPADPAMTLGNMREFGVQNLIASCLNDACRHQALIDLSSYPADTEVPYFRSKVVCAKCGSRGNKIDVRPNWKEQPTRPTMLRYDEPADRPPVAQRGPSASFSEPTSAEVAAAHPGTRNAGAKRKGRPLGAAQVRH